MIRGPRVGVGGRMKAPQAEGKPCPKNKKQTGDLQNAAYRAGGDKAVPQQQCNRSGNEGECRQNGNCFCAHRNRMLFRFEEANKNSSTPATYCDQHHILSVQ